MTKPPSITKQSNMSFEDEMQYNHLRRMNLQSLTKKKYKPESHLIPAGYITEKAFDP